MVPVLSLLISKYGLVGAAIGVFWCSVLLYVVFVRFTSRCIFSKYSLNEPAMLIAPLLVSIPVFLLLQRVLIFWPHSEYIWMVYAVIGAIASYLIIFRSSLMKIKPKNWNS